MKKRNQPAKAQSDKKGRPRTEPAVVAAPTSDLVGLAELMSGPVSAASDGSVAGQATWLSDGRLHGVQQRALAARIGRVQGNRHLQTSDSLSKGGKLDHQPPEGSDAWA